MNKRQLNIFNELWKVKLLKSLLDNSEMMNLKAVVTRTEKTSIERDLRMIRYGFEEGIKREENKTDKETKRLYNEAKEKSKETGEYF